MRISDWISYVFSSDLDAVGALLQMRQVDHEPGVDVEAEALAVAAHRRQVPHRTIGLPLALLGGHALGEDGQPRRARPLQPLPSRAVDADRVDLAHPDSPPHDTTTHREMQGPGGR